LRASCHVYVFGCATYPVTTRINAKNHVRAGAWVSNKRRRIKNTVRNTKNRLS
jgi:hypothetical protein